MIKAPVKLQMTERNECVRKSTDNFRHESIIEFLCSLHGKYRLFEQ